MKKTMFVNADCIKILYIFFVSPANYAGLFLCRNIEEEEEELRFGR